jgi:amino acid adenylation domain-containing protein
MKNEILHIYAASSLQQGFIYHALSQPEDDAYRVQLLLDYHETIDVDNYIKAWELCINRYPVLRTAFDWEDGVLQIVYKYGKLNYELHDLSPLASQEERDEAIVSIQVEDRKQSFDLRKPTLIRLHIIKQAENYYTILKTEHHSIADGWSLPVLLSNLHQYYQALKENKEVIIKEDTAYLKTQEYIYKHKSTIEQYWKMTLAEVENANDVSALLSKPIELNKYKQVEQSAINSIEISGNFYKELKSFSQREGITVNVIVQFIWHKLLQVYSNSLQSIVGTTISGRDIPVEGIEESVGLYINTLPLLISWENKNTIKEQLQLIQQKITEMNTHGFAELAKLQRAGERIFHSLLVYENYPGTKEGGGAPKISVRNAIEKVDYPLTVMAYEYTDTLVIRLGYDSNYLTEEKARQHIATLEDMLHEVVEHSGKLHADISLLGSQDYNTLIYDWNATDKEFPKDKTIHELFEEQVKKNPDNIALVYEEQQLTYHELNEKSNQLARYIQEYYKKLTKESLTPDTLIALFLDRSVEMIIGILAVLKSGGAYVPMDPSYPQERINYLLEDANAEIVLTQRHVSKSSKTELPADKIVYIDLTEELYVKQATSNLSQHIKATDLAYVIYTSGTTGKPKGVMIEHRNYIQLNSATHYNCFFERRTLWTNYTFDVSVFEIFNALLQGSQLYVLGHELRLNVATLFNFLNVKKINYSYIPPFFIKELATYLSSNTLSSLKRILTGVDKVSVDDANKIVSASISVLNGYGPTETSICSTAFYMDSKRRCLTGQLPIGIPLSNEKAFVLDSNHKPVPTGVIGELYLGGAGLARGYLNRPDLTSERFIPNPFATEADKAKGYSRLYKTGDLVRWLPDGNLEYIGRSDDQVKIRGYRIELGEIENVLSRIEGIKQSCVLAKEIKTETGSNKYIAAYYVQDNSVSTFTQTAVLEKLSQLLPEYMVPAAFVMMESFPLTINGKLDKRALPDPDFSSSAEEYVEPTNELEIKLCKIYSAVLGLQSDKISTHQNFFSMGGNSILSIQLKYKLNQLDEFKHISIADLFNYNSINKLIESIQQDNSTAYKLQDSTIQRTNHEIAIIGISGAFSGVKDVAEFWQLISKQQEGVHFYSKKECRQAGIPDSIIENPAYIPVTGKVKDIDLFDPLFWGLSPNEAKQLDPQIRKFIEHCWFALESSGYAQERSKHHIGVFAGSGNSIYFQDHILNGEMADRINMWETAVSNSKDALATKTAYLLGLSGAANSINTACSTGLVAVAEACKNLQLGTCTMALAGGVSLSMPDQIGYIYQEGMILSKDGHCKTFDSGSSGTISGSGIGVVLLKRLEDAVKDKDAIIGVVKGYATNNDGARKTGYTAPSVIGQSECIINAQKMAGITSDQIDYVECHGTATYLGDPIEVQALREAFAYNKPGKNNTTKKIVLGAVKANIGHCDSAAGIAGLIKVCKMLQNDTLPGQVNFITPNTELHLGQTNFEILKENRDWLPSLNKQRIAGVSSFGIGGTNAHVIVSDYIALQQKQDKIKTKDSSSIKEQDKIVQYIVPLSAKSRKSLEEYKQILLNHLSKVDTSVRPLSIQDIAYTLQERREHFNYRSAYCATSIPELITKLRLDTFYTETNTEHTNKIVFMFPGQGVQYAHMAKELYANEQFFKSIIDQCIALANQHISIDLYEVMYPGKGSPEDAIDEIQWTPISLFILEYALAIYLDHLGIKADAYIGHSFGEYVAATLSGVFTLEDAIKVVIARGKLMQRMQAGSMLAINAKEEIVKTIVEEHDCEIAVINSLEDIVVSGKDKAIKKLQKALDEQAIPTVKINSAVAGHSKMMEQAAIEFEKVFKNIKLHKPVKKFASNLTGEIAKEEVTTAMYWCDQLRNTVQFAKGINTLSKHYNHQINFVEVGTGKGLSYFVNKHVKANNYKSIQMLHLLPSAKEVKINKDQIVEYKENIMAKFWASGIIRKPNEINLFKGSKLETGLPFYQFDYQKCWINKLKHPFGNGSKNLLISTYKDELKKLKELTKSDAIELLEKLLADDKENQSEEVKQKNVNVLEDSYTETEYEVAQIIGEILGVSQISIHDNFFRIGGNSILAIQLSHRLSKALACDVKVADVFKHPTCSELISYNNSNVTYVEGEL